MKQRSAHLAFRVRPPQKRSHFAHRGQPYPRRCGTLLLWFASIDPKDLVRANDRTMVNDFAGAASLIAFLSRRGKPLDVRWEHDISPGDLRHAPVILIGGFDNPLTLEVTRQLRFEFAGGDHIRDRNNPRISWSIVRDARGNCLDDYVIITRLVQPKFGSTLITAAGIGPEGTQAAAEFLNNPQQIANSVKGLPRDLV